MVTREEPWPEGAPAWVELITPQYDLALRFYGELFGWRIVPGPSQYGTYGFALVGNRPTAGLGAARTGAAAWTTYLSVDDARRSCKLARENGGTVLAAPAPIGTQGWAALVADPTGAVVGLWQALNHIGTQIVDEPGAVCWSELLTPAPPLARRFYTAVFGHRHHTSPGAEDYTMAESPEKHARAVAGIGGMPGDGATWLPGPLWMPFFAVADVEHTAGEVEAGGGAVRAGPRRSPYGVQAVCADPSGALFTLIRLPRRR